MTDTAAGIYDKIGQGYATRRLPEPRWQARIDAEIPTGAKVLNVGAGAGSYEPGHARVVALEPSPTMIAQRPAGSAPVVHGVAEHLPFADRAFDVAMAVLTLHHWRDPARGLGEMQRVAQRQLVITWDQDVTANFWLIRDYLPQIALHDARLATLPEVLESLPGAQVDTLMVPADCSDGFLGAFWQKPEAYLDAVTRSAISGLALLDAAVVETAMGRLQRDLADGSWAQRNIRLNDLNELDFGYRLVVAE